MTNLNITVPEGKCAKWVNGVLTLVDEEDRPITERIKTFANACNALGGKHPFVEQYRLIANAYNGEAHTEDFIAYLKLRIIVAVLNEGWEPTFEEDEYYYYPWYSLLTKEEYDKLDEEDKSHVVGRSSLNAYTWGSRVFADSVSASSHSYASACSRLAFKTRELALYAGKQFFDEWTDFMFNGNGADRK